MKYFKRKKDFVSFLIKLFVVIFIFCLVFGDIKLCSDNFKKNNGISSPVEKNEINSITKENDKIVIEVKSLDSIKNEKVIEVESLDNDSTLRLFYKLIRK